MRCRAAVLVLCAWLGAWLGACAHTAPGSEAPTEVAPDDPLGAQGDGSPDALFARGLAWARRGDMVRAEQYMALAVRAGYPQEQALVAIVDACLAASRLRSALAYAEPYLRRHPDAWRVQLLVAAVHAALGRDALAITGLQRVIAQAPAGPDAYYLLAVLLHDRLDDEDGARTGFRSYLAVAPSGEHAREATAWLEAHPAPSAPARKRGRP